MLIQTCTLFSTQAEPFVNFSYYMKTHMSLPVLTTYVREARPFPERMLLCCMKTHISIRRKSSTITTTRHDDKLTNHLQGAMLTYSAPYLSLSCLVMPFLYEVCSTALRQLCTSRSNFSMSLNLMWLLPNTLCVRHHVLLLINAFTTTHDEPTENQPTVVTLLNYLHTKTTARFA